jgi:hypothetical protein
MTIRRVIVWVVSIAIGLALTAATIAFFGVGFEKFSTGFLFIGDLPLLLFLGYGSFAFIWMDYLFRTKYLRT